MNYVVFDLETQNTFQDVGSNDPADLAISVACAYDSATDSYHSFRHDELGKFWPLIEKTEALVGYNSDHFDIPLLNKYYPGDLMTLKSIDLMASIKQSLGRRIRLDTVAEATLGAHKSAHGLAAVDWWKSGDIESIIKYCLQDVKITKEIYEYALKNQSIKYTDGKEVKTLKINTAPWLVKKETTLTHALPF